MSEKFWTDKRVAILDLRWRERVRAAAIADEIGEGCTKNMCIGKANRLGLEPYSGEELRMLRRTAIGEVNAARMLQFANHIEQLSA